MTDAKNFSTAYPHHSMPCKERVALYQALLDQQDDAVIVLQISEKSKHPDIVYMNRSAKDRFEPQSDAQASISGTDLQSTLESLGHLSLTEDCKLALSGQTVVRDFDGGSQTVTLTKLTGNFGAEGLVSVHVAASPSYKPSNVHVETALNNAPIILFDLDDKGVFRLSRGKGLQALGLEPDQVVGMSAFDLYQDVPEVEGYLRRALAGETVKATVEGRGVAFDFIYEPQFDDQQQVTGIVGTATDVTAREEAKRQLERLNDELSEQVEQKTIALRQERDFAQSIINTAQAVILVLDLEGRIVQFNPFLEQLTGYQLQDLKGDDWFAIFLSAEERVTAKPLFDQILRGLPGMKYLSPIIDRHGKQILIEWYGQTLKDAEGNVVGLLAVGLDVSEREQVLQNLSESEERYRRLTENARDVIFRISMPDGRYDFINQACIELTGYSPQEYYNTPFLVRQLIHPDWRDYFERKWAEVLQGKAPDIYEYQIIHKSGEVKWVLQRNVLIVDDAGNAIGLEGIVTDITERKQAELQLKQSEARARALLDGIPDMMFRISREGIILDYKAEADELFVESETEVIGASIQTTMPHDFQQKVLPAIEQSLSTQTMQHVEYSLPFAERDRFYEARIAASGSDEVIAIVRDITERKDMEAALRQQNDKLEKAVAARTAELEETNRALQVSKKRWQAHYDQMPLPSYTWQKHGNEWRLVAFNQAAYEITQGGVEQFLGKTLNEMYPDRPTVHQAFRHCWAAQKVLNTQMDYTFVTINMTRTLDIHYVPIQPDVILVHTEDITSRVQAEHDLRIKERAIDHSINAIVFADMDGNLTYVNDSFLSLWGYTSEDEVLGRHASTFMVNPQDVHDVIDTLKTEKGWLGEFRAAHVDGTVMNLQVSSTLILDEDGKPLCMFGSFVDVTQEKQAQQALEKNESRLKQAQEMASLGYWEWDIKNGKLFWSEQVYEIFDVDPQTFSPSYERFLSFVHPDDRQHLEEAVEQSLNTGKPYALQHRIVLEDGSERIVYERAELTQHEAGDSTLMLGVVQDITELERTKQELQSAQEHLNRVARLSALGEIAAGVAHQINNPLTAVFGRTLVLLDDMAEDDPNYVHVEIMHRSIGRIGTIVNRMLNLSRASNTDIEPIDLNQSITDAIGLFRPQISGEPIDLDVILHNSPIHILGSEQYLIDVWLNILLNARDAMRDQDGQQKITVHVLLSKDENQVMVQFSDTGAGMTEEELGKIFTPFFTTKGDGIGLGLAICHDVITQHSGHINVTSELGGGTTFEIVLPIIVVGEASSTMIG